MRFVVDTSALVAIVNGEPEAERCHGLLLDHEPVVSCGTLIETLCVMQVGLGAAALRAIDRLIELYGVESVPVDAEQVAAGPRGHACLRQGARRGAGGLELRRPVCLRAGQTAAPAAAVQG